MRSRVIHAIVLLAIACAAFPSHVSAGCCLNILPETGVHEEISIEDKANYFKKCLNGDKPTRAHDCGASDESKNACTGKYFPDASPNPSKNNCVCPNGVTPNFDSGKCPTIVSETCPKGTVCFEPNVTIPFTGIREDTAIHFPDPNRNCDAATEDLYSDNVVGWYIGQLYTFMASIAGFIAVLFLIKGGIEYMMSRDTKGGQALGTMRNAVIGLVFIWGSYHILSLLSSSLVSFPSLNLGGICPDKLRSVAYKPCSYYEKVEDKEVEYYFGTSSSDTNKRTYAEAKNSILKCTGASSRDVAVFAFEKQSKEYKYAGTCFPDICQGMGYKCVAEETKQCKSAADGVVIGLIDQPEKIEERIRIVGVHAIRLHDQLLSCAEQNGLQIYMYTSEYDCSDTERCECKFNTPNVGDTPSMCIIPVATAEGNITPNKLGFQKDAFSYDVDTFMLRCADSTKQIFAPFNIKKMTADYYPYIKQNGEYDQIETFYAQFADNGKKDISENMRSFQLLERQQIQNSFDGGNYDFSYVIIAELQRTEMHSTGYCDVETGKRVTDPGKNVDTRYVFIGKENAPFTQQIKGFDEKYFLTADDFKFESTLDNLLLTEYRSSEFQEYNIDASNETYASFCRLN